MLASGAAAFRAERRAGRAGASEALASGSAAPSGAGRGRRDRRAGAGAPASSEESEGEVGCSLASGAGRTGSSAIERGRLVDFRPAEQPRGVLAGEKNGVRGASSAPPARGRQESASGPLRSGAAFRSPSGIGGEPRSTCAGPVRNWGRRCLGAYPGGTWGGGPLPRSARPEERCNNRAAQAVGCPLTDPSSTLLRANRRGEGKLAGSGGDL